MFQRLPPTAERDALPAPTVRSRFAGLSTGLAQPCSGRLLEGFRVIEWPQNKRASRTNEWQANGSGCLHVFLRAMVVMGLYLEGFWACEGRHVRPCIVGELRRRRRPMGDDAYLRHG